MIYNGEEKFMRIPETEGNKEGRLNPYFRDIENLSPSYFALVMATGIVSIAAKPNRSSL